MVSGYIIVKKPLAEDAYPGGPPLPAFNNIRYCGIKRSMWASVDDYFRIAANKINPLYDDYTKLQLSDNDGSYLAITKNLSTVQHLMAIDAEISERNEIIVISEKWITKLKGEAEQTTAIKWLGYDIVLMGGWSLIRHAIFENQHKVLYDACTLNEYGLLNDDSQLQYFLKVYNELAHSNKVDPLIAELKLLCIKVGRPE